MNLLHERGDGVGRPNKKCGVGDIRFAASDSDMHLHTRHVSPAVLYYLDCAVVANAAGGECAIVGKLASSLILRIGGYVQVLDGA